LPTDSHSPVVAEEAAVAAANGCEVFLCRQLMDSNWRNFSNMGKTVDGRPMAARFDGQNNDKVISGTGQKPAPLKAEKLGAGSGRRRPG
jgi:hypothetical protein